MFRYTIFICFFLIIIPFAANGQNVNTDSLKSVLNSAAEDTTKVNNLIALSGALRMTEPEEAISYATYAADLSDSLNFKSGLAYSLKSIGLAYYFQSDFLNTIQYWQESLGVFEEIGDKVGIANLLSNLGAVNSNEGDDTRALELYLQSLKIAEEIDDSVRIATTLINIGLVYFKNPKTYDTALDYYLRAIPIGEQLNYNDAIGTACLNAGEIYFKRVSLDTALIYFERSLKALEPSGNIFYSLNYIGQVYAQRNDFEEAIRYQTESYEKAKKVDAKLDMSRTLLGLADTYILQKDYSAALVALNEAKTISIEIGSRFELRDSYKRLADSYANLGDYKNAFFSQSLLTDIKDTLFNTANAKRIDVIKLNFDIDNKQGEINLLTKDKELQDIKIEKQRLVKNAFLVGLLLILLIAFIILRNYLAKVKINKILDKQNEEIEGLLLNILPGEVAKELQEAGKATPRDYESVSVLFTDFVGFSLIAKSLDPNDLVDELSSFFIAFDNITSKHNLEKIKTIGDAYMCAGGIPSPNESHPMDTVRAGLEMQEFMTDNNIKRITEGKIPWELRVGIHTGPIVAGVVGKKKYAYDIWGSTVNIASRMESNGESGRVNISESTYKLISSIYTCQHRGKISAKNVGEIDMYFVKETKP